MKFNWTINLADLDGLEILTSGLIYGTIIAIIAYAFILMLEPDKILDWYFRAIVKLSTKHPKIYNVLGGCEICIAGQLAFWLFLFRHLQDYSAQLIPKHLFMILISILITHILKLFLKWMDRLGYS